MSGEPTKRTREDCERERCGGCWTCWGSYADAELDDDGVLYLPRPVEDVQLPAVDVP